MCFLLDCMLLACHHPLAGSMLLQEFSFFVSAPSSSDFFIYCLLNDFYAIVLEVSYMYEVMLFFTVSLSSLLLLPALFSPVTLLFLPYHLCVWSTELFRVRSKTRVKKSVTIPLTKNSIWSLGPLTNKLETWLFALQFNPRIVTPKECSEVFFCAPYSGPNFWKQYTKICSLEPIV